MDRFCDRAPAAQEAYRRTVDSVKLGVFVSTASRPEVRLPSVIGRNHSDIVRRTSRATSVAQGTTDHTPAVVNVDFGSVHEISPFIVSGYSTADNRATSLRRHRRPPYWRDNLQIAANLAEVRERIAQECVKVDRARIVGGAKSDTKQPGPQENAPEPALGRCSPAGKRPGQRRHTGDADIAGKTKRCTLCTSVN